MSAASARRARVVAATSALAVVAGLLLPAATATTPAAAASAVQSCAETAGSPVIEAASWGQQRMGAERAWSRSTGDVVVAVLDTGVSAAAASLRGAVLPGTDLGDGTGDTDCFGRGTFVGSLIAGRQVEGTEFAGIAPGATILPVRITDDPDDFALAAELPGRLAAGIDAAVAGGAQIVAIPLTSQTTSPELEAAVAAATAADVLVVGAANAPTTEMPAYPAALDGVLSVAPYDEDGAAALSELGAAPDLAAPSGGLVGAVPDGDGHITAAEPDLAVAYAAGAAALVRAELPELSAAEVRERLMATADAPTARLDEGMTIHPTMGAGVVDPTAAVSRIDAETSVTAANETPTLEIPPEPDERPTDLALLVGIGVVAVALATLGPLLGIVAVRRRRAADAAA